DVCVAFAGGRAGIGPLRATATSLVVALGGEVHTVVRPLRPLRVAVDDRGWRLTGGGIEVDAHADGAQPHPLPVPVPRERPSPPPARCTCACVAAAAPSTTARRTSPAWSAAAGTWARSSRARAGSRRRRSLSARPQRRCVTRAVRASGRICWWQGRARGIA